MRRRRQTDLVHYEVDGIEEILALSAKPYFILDDLTEESGNEKSDTRNPGTLAGLLKIAQDTRNKLTGEKGDGEVARSQLKSMLHQLAKGKRRADNAWTAHENEDMQA